MGILKADKAIPIAAIRPLEIDLFSPSPPSYRENKLGCFVMRSVALEIYPGDASFYGMDGQNSGGRQVEIQVNGCDLPGYQQ